MADVFNIQEYRQYQQVIKDLPVVILLLTKIAKDLEKFKHYHSANEVWFYASENKQMLEAQLKFYKNKIENMRGSNEDEKKRPR